MDFKHRIQIGRESKELYFKQFVAVTDYQALYVITGLESTVVMIPDKLGDWEIIGIVRPQIALLQGVLSKVINDKLTEN